MDIYLSATTGYIVFTLITKNIALDNLPLVLKTSSFYSRHMSNFCIYKSLMISWCKWDLDNWQKLVSLLTPISWPGNAACRSQASRMSSRGDGDPDLTHRVSICLPLVLMTQSPELHHSHALRTLMQQITGETFHWPHSEAWTRWLTGWTQDSLLLISRPQCHFASWQRDVLPAWVYIVMKELLCMCFMFQRGWHEPLPEFVL